VKRYVLNQEAHHRKRSYADELFSLLRKHGIRDLESFALIRGRNPALLHLRAEGPGITVAQGVSPGKAGLKL